MEIHNGSGQLLDLDGMYLSDDQRAPTKWQIRSISIPASAFVVFWLDGDEPQGIHHAGFRLSASGEGIGIFDTDENGNALVDWITFGIQQPGVSYGRYPDGAKGLECFRQPTPGEPNLSSGGVSAVLNELMSSNLSTITDDAGEHDAWIELFNPGCDVVHLGGWSLSQHDGQRWLFPDIAMPPGTYLLLWADAQTEQGDLHMSFRLSPGGGNISLHSSDGAHAVDSVQYGEQPSGQSLGRHPNGVGDWSPLTIPSPGAENQLTELVINEIMARNRLTMADETGEYDDWVELHNPTDQPVFVGGLYLSDDLSNATQWELPGVEVPSHGFLLIWTDGQPEQGALHTNFSLTGDGETIALFDRAAKGHALLDSVRFSEQQSDISYGRYPDGSSTFERFRNPTPGMPNVSSSVTQAGSLTLLQNYPNPFTTETIIPYVLSRSAKIQLSIHNIQGQMIRHFELGAQTPGTYVTPEQAAHWSGDTDLGERAAPGVYFYTLQADEDAATRKLLLRH